MSTVTLKGTCHGEKEIIKGIWNPKELHGGV